jgi:hypothetical protein
MAKKADNFFVRVKAYRKEHPRATQEQAIAKLKGTSVSGVKKSKPVVRKAVSGVKVGAVKKAPKKRSIIKTERVTTIGSTRQKNTVAAVYSKGQAILRNIAKMTADEKKAIGITAKNFIRKMINKEHDKLDALTKKTA